MECHTTQQSFRKSEQAVTLAKVRGGYPVYRLKMPLLPVAKANRKSSYFQDLLAGDTVAKADRLSSYLLNYSQPGHLATLPPPKARDLNAMMYCCNFGASGKRWYYSQLSTPKARDLYAVMYCCNFGASGERRYNSPFSTLHLATLPW
ncbi:MAG: hypothetical protein PWP64_901 [Candidatus Cloacimonadota bacterium]|nr:hypothetical protein [Candidatus Cloacimonadota bacterium]